MPDLYLPHGQGTQEYELSLLVRRLEGTLIPNALTGKEETATFRTWALSADDAYTIARYHMTQQKIHVVRAIYVAPVSVLKTPR